MELTVSEAIERNQPLSLRVRRASKILEEVIGSSAGSVKAQWDSATDSNGRPLVLLNLVDFTGARAETRFAPDDLAQEKYLNAKFYKIWGDLLQDRSHNQLKLLSGNIQAGE